MVDLNKIFSFKIKWQLTRLSPSDVERTVCIGRNVCTPFWLKEYDTRGRFSAFFTRLYRMDSSTLNLWTGPIPVKGRSCYF